MGVQPASQTPQQREFFWSADGEPHMRRRKAILCKYGEQVRALYGTNSWTAVQVVAVTLLQFTVCYLVRNASWGKALLVAYVVGGTLTQNLFTAQHELSHFLALKKPLHNRILSWVSNCALAVPVATSFRKYHQEHHSHLGVEGWDVDLPTYIEANYVANFIAKTVWATFYIAVYGLRPLIVRPKPVGAADLGCAALVLGCDAAVAYFWGAKALMYLVAGAILGGGIHPMAGHLMAEHYMFMKGQETYSYYGPLNALTYNVGYHNEHHDFPQIPHNRLHKLHKIAPEFYLPLGHHMSWAWIIFQFLSDPEVGPWSRMKRKTLTGTPLDAGVPIEGKPTATATVTLAADASSVKGAVGKENVPPRAAGKKLL